MDDLKYQQVVEKAAQLAYSYENQYYDRNIPERPSPGKNACQASGVIGFVLDTHT